MMLDLDNGGWCKQTEIAAQGKAFGYSDKEIRMARKKLGIFETRRRARERTEWWMWGYGSEQKRNKQGLVY